MKRLRLITASSAVSAGMLESMEREKMVESLGRDDGSLLRARQSVR
jgi:hypothetical protein